MRRRLAELTLLAFVVAAVPACRIGRATTRTLGALVSTPRAVVKNRHPVTPDARLAVTWVGQATALVQIDDKVILTDPVFTSTVGQVSKRLVEAGLDPDDLPAIDAVLVSHLHYDHLSLGSIDTIKSRVRALLMPPGGTAYLTDFAFPVYELARWQTWSGGDLRVTAAPVEHVGGRYGIDSEWMDAAYTGYVIEYHGLRVYFDGASAYDQTSFAETGQRFPKIDLALLPIAPIEPRDLMRHLNMDPRQALQAFFDLGATRMVPIHYDTFIDSADEPGDALRALGVAIDSAKKRYSLAGRLVAPLAVGERRIFVKVGEAKAKGGAAAGTPAARPPTSSQTPSATATSTSKIPDDDKFE